MISILTTMLLIIVLFFTGRVFESIKRLLVLILNILLKILNLFGCKLSLSEPSVRTSKVFNKTFQDIKTVKKSKYNNKTIPSINALSLIVFLLSVTSIVINFTCASVISVWLFNKGFLRFIINTQENMDTTFVATMFSIVSFSLAKLVSQWKDTKKYRKARKQMKLKKKVISNMSSKELLDAAKEKDFDKTAELKPYSQEN